MSTLRGTVDTFRVVNLTDPRVEDHTRRCTEIENATESKEISFDLGLYYPPYLQGSLGKDEKFH